MKYVEIANESDLQNASSAVFRVRFWERPAPDKGENLVEYRLTEVDGVEEALQWCADNVNGRRIELFLEREELRETPRGIEKFAVLILLSPRVATSGTGISIEFRRGS